MEDKVIIKSIDDREFYRKMLVIGIPVVLQNFISIGLNLIDTLMIGMSLWTSVWMQ